MRTPENIKLDLQTAHRIARLCSAVDDQLKHLSELATEDGDEGAYLLEDAQKCISVCQASLLQWVGVRGEASGLIDFDVTSDDTQKKKAG